MSYLRKTISILAIVIIAITTFLFGCEDLFEPSVEITDEAFLEALIAQGIDADGDSIISKVEAKSVTDLNVGPPEEDAYYFRGKIESLSGIEEFKNLESLNCSHNRLKELIIKECSKITTLDCSYNQLTSLDVSDLPLYDLYCYGNEISVLDLSSNEELLNLKCGRQDEPIRLAISNCKKLRTIYANGINNINVNNQPDLKELGVGYSELTSLNVTNNVALKELYIFSTNISSINLSKNTALRKLYLNYLLDFSGELDLSKNTELLRLRCSNCRLTELDVSNNTHLVHLDCSWNQLSQLDISNNTELEYISLHDMPSISKVCVWTMPFPPEGVDVSDLYSPNIYFTTECRK